MRYFCTHPPPIFLIIFFTLSLLTLSLSLKTEQAQVMKNICNLQFGTCQWPCVTCSENKGDEVVGLDLSNAYIYKDVAILLPKSIVDQFSKDKIHHGFFFKI